jgi:hypothetical protein
MSQPSVGNGVDLLQSFPFNDILGGFEIDAVSLLPDPTDVRRHYSSGQRTVSSHSHNREAVGSRREHST